MSNIRRTVISNCEKEFLIKNLTEWARLDGRTFDEFRDVSIEFGKDWGCCSVSLGKTKTLAQVSCELQYPKASRPSEGILYINLELNPMADPNFEAGRPSELSAQLNRLLEKCIKDSKAVDLESLCVKMNERVWAFRVDINVLNYEGNVLDCASIAALAALAHFRRPDVTCDGIEYKIHSYKQRDPIPTVLHHYPICVTYGILKEGEFILADPTRLEEGVADAFLSIGLNAYRELCGLHLGGKVQLSPKIILETARKAAKRASQIAQMIKDVVEKDAEKRKDMVDCGFHTTLDLDKIDLPLSDLQICLDNWSNPKKRKKGDKNKSTIPMNQEDEAEDKCVDTKVTKIGNNTAEVIFEEKEVKQWEVIESDDDEPEEDEVVYVEPPKVEVETIDLADSDSEEDVVVVLNADKKTNKKKKKK